VDVVLPEVALLEADLLYCEHPIKVLEIKATHTTDSSPLVKVSV
jgi:hypothetical protein